MEKNRAYQYDAVIFNMTLSEYSITVPVIFDLQQPIRKLVHEAAVSCLLTHDRRQFVNLILYAN